MNTSHLNPELLKLSSFAGPAQNRTLYIVRHLSRLRSRHSLHPFPDSPGLWRLRCLGAFVSDVVLLELKTLHRGHRGVLHGLRHHLQLRDGRPLGVRCAVRIELGTGTTNKPRTFPCAKDSVETIINTFCYRNQIRTCKHKIRL